MSKAIADYPCFFKSMKPSSIELLGKTANENLWTDVYLRIDGKSFYVSVTPLLDDPEFDYVFCLELIPVDKISGPQLNTIALVDKGSIKPNFFSLSERLSGEARKSIKRITISDQWRRIVIEPSYDKYFSCHVLIEKNSGLLRPAF